MAAPATTNEFLDLVRKSGVVDDKRLDAHLEKLRAAKEVPTEPAKMAGILVRDGVLTHFQAEQILAGKWRRFTIGKYKVLERLGSGGMGSVYLCEHKLMKRRVAVKVLPTAKAADESSLQRFYREARAAAALDHPNIVHAYDIDQDDTLHFLVMEYVDGASLQELVKRSGPLEPGRAAHYIRQAALGLDHAHKSGLIHRDVKPGNILVDRVGTVKILDMGLARFFNDEEDMLTKKFDENVLGTADYLAPEQALDSHNVDIRADIYGLGATFYFLLSGRTPFGEGTTAQKLIWHQTRQPRPLTGIRNDVPPELSAVIEKMMAKDPGVRYQTPVEVADALAPFVPGVIPPPSDREMPQLSLAATGVNPNVEPTQVTQHPPASPGSGPRKNWQVTSTPSPRPQPPSPRAETQPLAGAPTQSTRVPVPAAQIKTAPPRAAAPQVRAAPAPPTPAEEEDSIPWERVTTDTEADIAAQVDTAPQAEARKRPGGRRSAVTRRPGSREARRFWLLAAGVGLLLVVGLVAAGIIFGVFGGRREAPTQRVLKVGVGHLRTVREALDRAQSGDRIVLVDPEHRELLSLPPRTWDKEGVRIEPGDGLAEVVWKPAGKSGDLPLLRVEGVKGLHLRGIRFDGEKKVSKLVYLTGHCPGLGFQDVVLKDFTKVGLTLANCTGDPDHRVELRQITAQAPNPNAEAPILFSATANNHIVVRDCRFQGQYTRPAAEWFKSGRGTDVEIKGNTPKVQ